MFRKKQIDTGQAAHSAHTTSATARVLGDQAETSALYVS